MAPRKWVHSCPLRFLAFTSLFHSPITERLEGQVQLFLKCNEMPFLLLSTSKGLPRLVIHLMTIRLVADLLSWSGELPRSVAERDKKSKGLILQLMDRERRLHNWLYKNDLSQGSSPSQHRPNSGRFMTSHQRRGPMKDFFFLAEASETMWTKIQNRSGKKALSRGCPSMN